MTDDIFGAVNQAIATAYLQPTAEQRKAALLEIREVMVIQMRWISDLSTPESIAAVERERIDDCPMCGDSPGSYAYCLEHGELG